MNHTSLTPEEIKNQFDPDTILRYYNFRNVRKNGNTLRSCCAIHNGDNDTGFIWNLENNLWYCYTGDCGGGDIYDLVMKMEGVDFKTAVHKVTEIYGIDETSIDFTKRLDIINEQRNWLQKSKKHQTIEEEYINRIPHRRYSVEDFEENILTHRFKPDTFQYYNSYFTKLYPTETRVFKDKLIVPIKSVDIQVGVAMRNTSVISSDPKWLYAPKGIKTSNILYNYDEALQSLSLVNEIILTEGIFDVWAYHEAGIDNAVAIFGSNLSDTQLKMILKPGANITLSFDNDKAGNKCTEKVIKKLKNKTEIRQVLLPSDSDPGDISREELRKCYLNRVKI